MAEVIDICFIDNNPEQYKSMLDIFQSYFGKSIDACSTEIMDNWEYSNLKVISEKDLMKYVNTKIVRLVLTCGEDHIVITIEKMHECYQIDGCYNPRNEIEEEEYRAFLKWALEKLKSNNAAICAIGRETLIHYSTDLNEMRDTSHGVDAWIVRGEVCGLVYEGII